MEEAGDEKVNLNASDDDEDITYDDFRIRPQFQGPHGQELLELNTRLPERFKLDERFAEFLESEDDQESVEEKDDVINKERNKNFEILQSVLGHEISSRSTDKAKSQKRHVRFDPDDEKASHLVKSQEAEKTTKSKKKKKEVREDTPIPISTERYIEVHTDLKELLNSTTPFSFSKQFGRDEEEEVETAKEIPNNIRNINKYSDEKGENSRISFQEKERKNFLQKESNDLSFSESPILPKSAQITFRFFVEDGDPRIKEGIEFFRRSKPIHEIREEWIQKRKVVLDLFKRKRRSGHRPHTTRVQSTQRKFAVRRDFKR